MTNLLINILAFGTLLSSVFTITSKNPVISVIFLISTFVQAALYLILIGINFVGISYIVIYVGAIAVLFLFVIMMINIKLTDILETGNQYTKNIPLAIVIGSLFIFIIFQIIPFNFNNIPALSILLNKITDLFFGVDSPLTIITTVEVAGSIFNPISSSLSSQIIPSPVDLAPTSLINNYSLSSDVIVTEFQQIEVLGHGLYTYGAFLLIILSLLLLLAIFATVLILNSTQVNLKNQS
jgi:NADH-ubiquinone oxidoreductase chain 6